MKKRDLQQIFDDELLDKLFGFCYVRTNDSYEAEALCSDIVYALVKAAQGGWRDRKYARVPLAGGAERVRGLCKPSQKVRGNGLHGRPGRNPTGYRGGRIR